MTIEIIETQIVGDPFTNEPLSRAVNIVITSGSESYLYSVGGLPLTGSLQTVLDAQEADIFTLAQAGGEPVDLYELTVRKVLKAFALVTLDEINILRVQAGLTPRTPAQAHAALKSKMKGP